MQTLEDLPDDVVGRLTDYTAAAAHLTTGRHDFRIPPIVAMEWATGGVSVLKTNVLARRFGTTRRTVCKALKRLAEADVIRLVGRTAEGHPQFVPVLERGDEWRADFEGRNNGER
jgi:CRP-like cAMP-binding protein